MSSSLEASLPRAFETPDTNTARHLPAGTAKRVRAMAKARKTSASRVLVDLIETGLEAKEAEKERFFVVAERFKETTDPESRTGSERSLRG